MDRGAWWATVHRFAKSEEWEENRVPRGPAETGVVGWVYQVYQATLCLEREDFSWCLFLSRPLADLGCKFLQHSVRDIQKTIRSHRNSIPCHSSSSEVPRKFAFFFLFYGAFLCLFIVLCTGDLGFSKREEWSDSILSGFQSLILFYLFLFIQYLSLRKINLLKSRISINYETFIFIIQSYYEMSLTNQVNQKWFIC